MKKRALLVLLVVTMLVFACSFGASAKIIASGGCGEVGWALDDQGVMTIFGSGQMGDGGSPYDFPWAPFRDDIQTIVVEEGVTYIGHMAFAGCGNLEYVSLSNTVKTIAYEAFINCPKLDAILIPVSVTDMGFDLFSADSAPCVLCKPGSAAETYAKEHAITYMPYFDDVMNASDYYFLPVYWMKSNDIVKGVSEDLFGPDQPCTRGQVVTFIWRLVLAMEGMTEQEGKEFLAANGFVNPFADVENSAYYRDAVVFANAFGITTGTDASHFSPNAPCTREQVVTFFFRYMLAMNEFSDEELATFMAQFTNPFADVTDSDYSRDAVVWAAGVGITKGTDAGHFSPKATCTRAQIVTFLYRFIFS